MTNLLKYVAAIRSNWLFSERELIYDDVVHAEASAYTHWTDFLISKDVRLYYAGLQLASVTN